MKIRHGFVSNSSSTSFYFVGKSDKLEHFQDLVIKHGEHFDVSSPYGEEEATSAEVAKALSSGAINPIDKLIEELLGRVVGAVIGILRGDGKDYSQYSQWYEEDYRSTYRELNKLRRIKQAGFTHVLEASFGDNEGITGPLGAAMDYGNRNVGINEPDFIVWAECKH